MRILEGGDGPTAVFHHREMDWRKTVLLGVMAGALPMMNTHCFLALGLLSAGWMIWDLVRSRHQRKTALIFWGVYGGLAVLLAAPQLFTWTFRQATGSDHFLRFRFNWVNGELGMLDSYPWFWIKNVGLPFVLILLAVLEKNEKRRFLACGAFMIFLVAEFIQFQPNVYDNNKLFYIWYMICAVIAADYALELFEKLKGTRARYVLAGISLFVFFASGALSIAREVKSDYWMFSPEDVEAAEYIEENILFRHPTLPIGEFAIGTNTTAYQAARKYDIGEMLPILIAEKTGPHFAFGDTCYSRQEDMAVYNPDKKEIIARDNECSILRKTDPVKAYYNCHTDITIPYDELGSVRVLCRDGSEISLLEDGRFVLSGTEELNIPLGEDPAGDA